MTVVVVEVVVVAARHQAQLPHQLSPLQRIEKRTEAMPRPLQPTTDALSQGNPSCGTQTLCQPLATLLDLGQMSHHSRLAIIGKLGSRVMGQRTYRPFLSFTQRM